MEFTNPIRWISPLLFDPESDPLSNLKLIRENCPFVHKFPARIPAVIPPCRFFDVNDGIS